VAATVWTQRDQIQAYQFPRTAVSTAAAFGVIDLLDPSGSADWRQGGQVTVAARRVVTR
jgi:hypothetical protein